MTLKLYKPLCFIDIETTGLNILNDRIIEISIVKVNTDDTRETFTRKINSTIPISPAVSVLTGIIDADVSDAPTFKELSEEIYKFLMFCDLAGHNIQGFLLPFLTEEMEKAGILDFPFSGAKLVDTMEIFSAFEPHNLPNSYRFYCQKELPADNTTETDALASVDIFKAQLEKYGGENMTKMFDDASKYRRQT